MTERTRNLGTLVQFTALAAARHRVFAGAGWDVESDGLIGAPPLMLVVSDEALTGLIYAAMALEGQEALADYLATIQKP